VVVQLPMAKRARRLEPAAAPVPRATASDGSAGCPPVAAAAADDEGEAAGAEGFAALAAVQAAPGDDPAGDAVAALDDATAWERCDQWPFEPLCAELRCSLFQPRWQRRHGAALGLRAVLRAHAATAGAVGGVSARVRDELRAQWLQDCALRLICVLSLDRFGDWAAGDKVVAPVRETAAQALAVLLQPMTAAAAAQVAQALLVMARQPTWEVRHAAMLGLKYLLAVRTDLLPTLLPQAAEALRAALADDHDDDVRCVAAEALGGVAARVGTLLSPGALGAVLGALWDVLLELDELTSSAAHVMTTLSAYCACLPYSALSTFGEDEGEGEGEGGGEGEGKDGGKGGGGGASSLATVVPRLWPFWRHPSATARAAAIRTLEALLNAISERRAAGAPALCIWHVVLALVAVGRL
jgi:TATA-binding protein-associated factor